MPRSRASVGYIGRARKSKTGGCATRFIGTGWSRTLKGTSPPAFFPSPEALMPVVRTVAALARTCGCAGRGDDAALDGEGAKGVSGLGMECGFGAAQGS